MRFSIFISILFISNLVQAGGGWPRAKGQLFYKASYWTVAADQYFNQDAVIISSPDFAYNSLSIYGEYGLSNRLTTAINLPLLSKSAFAEGQSLSSIGDVDFSLSYNLINKGIVFSPGILIGIPLGKSQPTVLGTLQTGDQEFNQMLFAELGTGLKIFKINGYATALLGYNNRAVDYSDELHLSLKVGFKLLKEKLGLSVSLYSVSPLQKDANAEVNGLSIFSNKKKYVAFTPEVYYQFSDKIGISASMGGASLSSNNILARPSFSFGVFGQMN